jgi:hypothetical protein
MGHRVITEPDMTTPDMFKTYREYFLDGSLSSHRPPNFRYWTSASKSIKLTAMTGSPRTKVQNIEQMVVLRVLPDGLELRQTT